jgi:hypothetical protein
VRQLRNGDQTALQLGNSRSLCSVCLNKVPCCEEVRDLLSLSLWQLLYFLPNDDADPVKECRKGRVVLPCARLPQKVVLVCGLVSENKDVHDGKVIKKEVMLRKMIISQCQLGQKTSLRYGVVMMEVGFRVRSGSSRVRAKVF